MSSNVNQIENELSDSSPRTTDAVDRSLGLKRGVVRLADSDPNWPMLFEVESGRIASHLIGLGAPQLALQHIGSTSVRGLVAKPILDLLAGYQAPNEAGPFVSALESLGYSHLGERGVAGRQFLARGSNDARTHYVHLVVLGGQQWVDCLAFRDRLRRDPEAAAEYGRVKRRLAADHELDRAAYTDGKAEFIAGILDRGDLAG